MNLFKAEAKRLLARRFTRVMVAISIGILGLIIFGVATSTQRPTPTVIAQAEQRAAEERARLEQDLATCEAAQSGADSEVRPLPPDMNCRDAFDPAQVRAEYYLPHTFAFADEVPTLLTALGGIVALVGFAVGASFIGAEWNSGAMMNLLLWRPRRIPVLLTKLGTVLVGVLALGVVAGAGYLAALWAVAATRGRPGSLTAEFWQSLGLTAARTMTLAMAAAAIGFALASLGRHTAMALGGAISYMIIGEVGMQVVFGIAEISRPERFQLSSYAWAWLNNGATFEDFSPCLRAESGFCEPLTWRIDLADAALVGSALVLVLVGAAIWQMARRDVT